MTLFLLNLAVGGLVGALAGYLGSLMVGRKMGLVGGPLGHLALPGIALALAVGFNFFLGALFSIVLGVVFVWFLEKKTPLPTESLTGIVFASGVALGFLFLPLSEAERVVVGDVTEIGVGDGILTLAVAGLVFFIMARNYSKIVLSAISEELALGKEIEVGKTDLLYLLVIALLTALEVKIVGALLTAALFVIPASSARNVSFSLGFYKKASILFGTVSALGGIFLWKWTLLPAGPLIIVFASCLFLVSLLVKKLVRRKIKNQGREKVVNQQIF